MKLLLTTFCAALFISPLAFAEAKKCEKKCDKEKEETIAHCGKCGKGEKHEGEKKEEAKKEGAVIAEAGEKKCDKKCDKAKEETLLADCKKCDKDKKKEEAKKEGTVIAEAGQKKCGKKCDKEAFLSSWLLHTALSSRFFLAIPSSLWAKRVVDPHQSALSA